MVSVGDRVRLKVGQIPPHRCEGQTGIVIPRTCLRPFSPSFGHLVQMDGGGVAFAREEELETIDTNANGESES